MSTEQPDPLLCPLCGADNRCAVTRGKTLESCWCADVDISRNVLEAIPPNLREKACICPRCAAVLPPADDGLSTWSKT